MVPGSGRQAREEKEEPNLTVPYNFFTKTSDVWTDLAAKNASKLRTQHTRANRLRTTRLLLYEWFYTNMVQT